MAKTDKGTLKVFNTLTRERDTEHEIVHVTENGMFAVVKFDKEYPTFHVNAGLLVPGNVESSRTQKNAKKFAEDIAAQNWFTIEGRFVSTVDKTAIRSWLAAWTPDN